MGLLTLEEIRIGLDKEFLPLEPMLLGFRLIPSNLPNDAIVACENRLSVSFPPAFRASIASLDFGRLTIGPVVFCNTGNYLDELVTLNEQVHWWGSGSRPRELIMIANSDPYPILTNTETGEVLAMDPERGWHSATMIARDFECFLRGIGTVFLLRNSVLDKAIFAQAMCRDVDGQDVSYWLNLAS